MATYQNITPSEARELLAREATKVLDARDHRSYRVSHIEGAVLLHDGLMKALVREGEFDRPILIYCYRGATSQEKAQLFADLGFRRVYSLSGGYTDWTGVERSAALVAN